MQTPWGRTSLERHLPLRTDAWDRRIAALDPRKDYLEIVDLLSNHVFPLEILLALELAQLRTFTIPSISALLHATAEYEREGQKRLDDTRAVLSEVFRPGLESPEGRAMVEHLNRIHGVYAISNDDFLYTLSTFVFDPALFVDRWGHRSMTEGERDAFFFLYRRLGEHMKLRELPESRAQFLAWRRRYEAEHQRYSAPNEKVARGLLTAAAAQLPRALAPLLEPLTVVLMDDPAFRDALGLKPPPPALGAALAWTLRGYQAAARRVNPYERARFLESAFFERYPSYPAGYERMRLGPKKVLAMLDARDAAARRAA